VNRAAPKFAALAIRKAAELNWKLIPLLGVGSVLGRCGSDARKHRECKRTDQSSFKEAGDPDGGTTKE